MPSNLRSLTLLLMFALGLAAGGVSGEVPSIIVDEHEAPVWVSVEEITRAEGLRLDLLPVSTQGRIQHQLESVQLERLSAAHPEKLNRCSFLTLTSHTGKPPLRPLESPQDLASTAEIMVYGKVTDVAQGFHRGGEAAVLELAIDNYLKLPDGLDPVGEVFVVYRWAELEINGEVLCYRAERSDVPPEVGSTVLLVLERPVDFSERLFVEPRDHELFFSHPDGTVSASRGYPKISIPFGEFLDSMKRAGGDR